MAVNTTQIEKILERGKKAKPLSVKNGIEIYSPELYVDAQVLRAELEKGEKLSNTYLNPLEHNQFGSFNDSGTKMAIYPEKTFLHRVRIVDNEGVTEVHLVNDIMSVDQQASGKLSRQHIEVFVLVAEEVEKPKKATKKATDVTEEVVEEVAKPTKVKVARVEKILPQEFINEFKNVLGLEQYMKYSEIITEYSNNYATDEVVAPF